MAEIPEELYRERNEGASIRSLSRRYGIDRRHITRALNYRDQPPQVNPGDPYREIIAEVDKALRSGNVSPMARPALLAQKRAALDALGKQDVKRDGRDKITTLAEMVRMDAALDHMAADPDERDRLAVAYAERFGTDERELLARFQQRVNQGPKPAFVDDGNLPPEGD